MSWLLIIPLMIVCLFLNIRVYLAMFIGIIAYFLFFSSVPIEIAVQRLIAPTQSPSLLAIPFFILLGTLMSYTGIAERILHIANVLVGKMRGGLGVANILVSTMMGGVSASNLADAAMLSRMMVPEMERKGYNRAFAAAITAGGSLVTPIIPPGIALIIYGLVADVSIGKMFIAGLVPGLLCAVVLMFTIYLVARKTNAKPSRESWPTGKEVVFSLGQAWPALFLIFAVVGGIRANIFTPTEAGAVAVLIVLAIGFFIYREMRISHVVKALGETARATASVMLVIMASAALGWIFSMEHAGVACGEFCDFADRKQIHVPVDYQHIAADAGDVSGRKRHFADPGTTIKTGGRTLWHRSGAFWHHHDLQPVDWRIHATGRYRDAAGM